MVFQRGCSFTLLPIDSTQIGVITVLLKLAGYWLFGRRKLVTMETLAGIIAGMFYDEIQVFKTTFWVTIDDYRTNVLLLLNVRTNGPDRRPETCSCFTFA